MSNKEKQEEVAGGSSIMKDVWEIRIRDHGKKTAAEQQRRRNSALDSISQEWEDRLLNKSPLYKRVERKDSPEKTKANDKKTTTIARQQPQIPTNGPRAVPTVQTPPQKRGFSAPVPSYKKISKQDQTNKPSSLCQLSQTQPAAMVWAKSWKFTKGLPLLEKEVVPSSLWGHSWMFATQQPYTEAGHPWPNGPNKVNPLTLRLWENPACKVVSVDRLDFSLPADDWEESWRKSDTRDKREMSSGSGENVDALHRLWLTQTQCRNENLCTSAWADSWKSTKPSSQREPDPPAKNDPNKDDFSSEQAHRDKCGYEWEECWKYFAHQVSEKSKSTPRGKSQSPEWVDSWKVAVLASEMYNNRQPSVQHGEDNIHDYPRQQKEEPLHKVIVWVSREKQNRNLCFQLFSEFKVLSEWSKSWKVTKNNSKPSDEIEKVLKVSTPKLEDSLAQRQEKESIFFTSENADYENLKHKILSPPKTASPQTEMLCLNQPQNVFSGPEWKNSWRTLKHFIRMERRTRPRSSRTMTETGMEGERMTNTSEWNNSWKSTNLQTLQQEAAPWQRGWPTAPQSRAVRAMDHNHFRQVEPPRNGPGVARPWADSWSFHGSQRTSEHRSGSAQIHSVRPRVAPHQTEDSQRGVRRNTRSLSDWQEAWMISETQFRHDRPSLTQWMEAWRRSNFQTQSQHELTPRQNWMDESLEIQLLREKVLQGAKTGVSQSVCAAQDSMQRNPEDLWSASWKLWPLLNNQQRHPDSSSQQQQSPITDDEGAKWGKCFRIANPMPQTERPWIQSTPNLRYHRVMWPGGGSTTNHPYSIFNTNDGFKYWENSHRLLQQKTTDGPDPWLIVGLEFKTKKLLRKGVEGLLAEDRKWKGCHLLAKTQPCPMRTSTSKKIVKPEEKSEGLCFYKWAESWRSSAKSTSLENHMSFKSPTEWKQSWKFLIPPHNQV